MPANEEPGQHPPVGTRMGTGIALLATLPNESLCCHKSLSNSTPGEFLVSLYFRGRFAFILGSRDLTNDT